MPPLRHQGTLQGISGNRLLVRPGAAPAILLWMQGETRRGSPPGDGSSEAMIVRRAALLFAFILCGGLVLACMLPPLTDAGMPQIAIKVQTLEESEAEEQRALRLATSAGAFDRGRDLRQNFSDVPPITVLQEPMIDTALSSLSPAVKPKEALEPERSSVEPLFAQEFWRTMGNSRLGDAYAAYLGRYSWKIGDKRHNNFDRGALAQVDEEEMKRLDARRSASSLHISLSDVPIPRRAPRAASVRTRGAAKTARKGCRNRIWRCTPPIANMAQGSAQRLRSRHN
jgi:hypothetical protein